jgi:hypothetical protein
MRSLFLSAILLLSLSYKVSATNTLINVLIIGNAEPDNIAELTNGLRQFPDFGNIKAIEWYDPPTNSVLVSYDAVLVTVKYSPVANSLAWSDIIADFAINGGGVVCGFAYYDTGGPVVDHGKLALPENNPFPRGPRLTVGELGDTLIPGHPLMEDVNQRTTNYRYDIAPNSNAVVVATFTDGLPFAGYLEVGHGRVVGIQAHFRPRTATLRQIGVFGPFLDVFAH